MSQLKQKSLSNEAGFSLLECLCAMVITLIGILAVEMLIVEGIRLQTVARDATAANALAKTQLEWLRSFPLNAPQRSRGGSISTNVANYNDNPDPRFRRRWRIETNLDDATVPAGTQRVRVTVVPAAVGGRLPSVLIETLIQ